MKNLFKLLISLLLIVGIYPKTHAYEVYEHNAGDANHLVSKKKVMDAPIAQIYESGIPILSIETNLPGDDFYITTNANRKSNSIQLNHSLHDAHVRFKPGCIELKDDNCSFIVEYLPSGTEKLYKVTITTNNGETIVIEGLPTFYEEKGYTTEVVGTEKSIGVQPVFLEWLEHWAKKKKFKDYNKLY